LQAVTESADRLAVVRVLRAAFEGFAHARGAEAAAAMAYYALLSLFPLLLALVAAASFVLDREQALQQAVSLLTEAIPVSQRLVEENLRQVISLRGPIGLLGLAGTLWSASGFFTVLSRAVSRAWPGAEQRGFLRGRLVALAMVALLLLLLVISLLSAPIVGLLGQYQVPLWGGTAVYATPLWAVLSRAVPWLSTFLLFVALYHWVPNTRTDWRGTLWSAAVATTAWQLAAWGFGLYLSSGLARYQLVYGSLGTVVVMLIWIYLSSWIITFGAHLGAAIAGET
jgi:membrane protein